MGTTRPVGKDISLDLADQTGRNLGRANLEFARKLSRRIRRKFAVTTRSEIVFEQVIHFGEIYQFAGTKLGECIHPSPDGYASSKNVDDGRFLAIMVEKFSNDDPDILKLIGGWVVFYEYFH
jgi:hypothetical protein